MEPRIQLKIHDQQSDWKTKEKMEANLLRKRQKTLTESSSQINKTWINTAKDRGRWTLLEENYTKKSERRQENNARTRTRRNNQGRPARYVNGVRLSGDQVANIT